MKSFLQFADQPNRASLLGWQSIVPYGSTE